MHQLITYLLGLVIILLSSHTSSSIEIPDIRSFETVRARKNDKSRKILRCAVRGADLDMRWTFNGTTIKQTEPKENSKYEFDNDDTLMYINHVVPSDSGAYRCYASNSYGMVFKEIRLKIVGIGKFQDGYREEDLPITYNVTVGKPYELKCPPHTHMPGQSYQWAVPPMEIWKTGYPSERVFQTENHGSLFFSYVTKDDIERIRRKDGLACILYNDYTSTVVSTQIIMRSDLKDFDGEIKPDLVVPLKPQMTAVEDSKKVVTCGVTGKPHPKFEWFKDGSKITTDDPQRSTVKNIRFEGRGVNLVMDPVDGTDNGRYKCVASNSKGKVESEGTVTVHSNVKFTKKLVRKNYVPVGEPITLECAATGFPKPEYIWYHNSSIVKTTAKRTITQGRLNIPASDYADCGMYLCTAENMLNTVVSPAYVKIQDVAPEITKGLDKSYDLLYGTDKTLVCEASGGPTPTISWFKNGVLVVDSDKLEVQGGTLKFKSIVKDLDGEYKCVAKNRKDEASSTTTVQVYYIPPVIKEGPGNKTYYMLFGTSQTIPCKAEGVPQPKITWYKNDAAVQNGDKISVNGDGSLQFTGVSKDEVGVYKCVAENLATAVQSSATIQVYYPTAITEGPSDVSYPAGSSAYLFCKSTVDPDLITTRQWLKDGEVIEYNDKVFLKDSKRVAAGGPMSHTLQVDDLVASDGGVYKCKITSKDDATFTSEAEDDGSITVIMAPLPAANLKIRGSFGKGPKKTDDSGSGTPSPKTTGTDGSGPDGRAGTGESSGTPAPSGGGGAGSSGTPAPTTSTGDDDVILSWDKPNKYVGPAEEYIIEYAPAGTPEDSPKWKQYDPPKKYKGTEVKLEADKLPAGEDVVLRVKAVTNHDGEDKVGEPSKPTEGGSLVTPKRAPSVKPSNVRLEPKDDGNNNVSVVTWDKLDDTEKPGPNFEVEVSFREKGSDGPFEKTSSKDDGVDNDGATGPPISETGEDKEYEVKVKTKNDNGDGPEAVHFLKVPGKKVTTKVSDVTLISKNKNEATIKWKGVTGATGYRIYYTKKVPSNRRRRTTGTPYVDVTGTQGTIKALEKGTEYDFEVAAKNLKGVGPKSDVLTVNTDKGVPERPKDVDVVPYGDKVRVSWPKPSDPDDVKNYTVSWYPKDDPTKKKSKVVPGGPDGPDEAFIDDDLDPDKYYTVELTPNNDEGSGEPSVTEGVVVGLPDAPGTPGKPSAKPLSTTDIEVTFNLPDGQKRGGIPEEVDICYEPGKVCFTRTFPNDSSAKFENLETGKPYNFYTIAKNSKGESDKSATISMKTLDPPTTTATTTENVTVIVKKDKSFYNEDKPFYNEIWFIILLIILIILIIIAIILCIICNRRGGRYPVGEKEKKLGGWDREALKEYDDDDSTLENGVGVPLVPPNRSPDRDSIKKAPFQDDVDDDVDSLADYGEGYGDMDQYGSDKKDSNGQTVC